jgi:SAM-dependent methyltransferase
MESVFKRRWADLLDRELQFFIKNGPRSVFSIKGTKGAKECGMVVRGLLNDKDSCLDVGCGMLPLPYYMQVADNVCWSGIDPHCGESRMFNFYHGMAEELPFDDFTFDCVLFSTSLDHCLNPLQASREALRVVKDGGFIVYWGGVVRDNNAQYLAWKRDGGLFDNAHMWAFSKNDLNDMFGDPVKEIVVRKTKAGMNIIIVYKK